MSKEDKYQRWIHDARNVVQALSLAMHLYIQGEVTKAEVNRISHSVIMLLSSDPDLPETKSVMDLSLLLSDCAKVMSPKAIKNGVSINLDIPKLPSIIASKVGLERVILNLLENAIKYRRTENPEIWLSAKITQHHLLPAVTVYVEDNGIGIPSEDESQVFHCNYRVSEHKNKASGSGLGLSNCKNIIDAHSGQIGVNSKLNQGSCFWFTLPIAS